MPERKEAARLNLCCRKHAIDAFEDEFSAEVGWEVRQLPEEHEA
jgi:hypothetical protein